MWNATSVVRELRRRGELWEPVPGLTSLRGDVLVLFEGIEARITRAARAEDFPEWRLAPGLDFRTLDQARYFESFPQWLTAAGHLSGDPAELEGIARAPDCAAAAARALEPAECALSPALCYHTYARFAGASITTARMTAQGTCWRHEGDRRRPLERGWAFTMRELVHIGSANDAEAFRIHGMRLAGALAAALGLSHAIEPASDPFFAPTSRGKALLQKVKGLKHELTLPIGDGRTIAAASFNNHETYFGDLFDIRTRGGQPAVSACVAFGIERWLLACLVAHGPDADAWPEFDAELAVTTRIC